MQAEFKDERAAGAATQVANRGLDNAMAETLYAGASEVEASISDLAKFRPATGSVPGFGEIALYPSNLEAEILASEPPPLAP